MGGVAALLAGLGACSAIRFAYNQGPQWAYWWLNRYADFTEEQEPRVREAVEQWFSWHRRTQLPDYAVLLERARADAQKDVTTDQVCNWWETMMKRGDDAIEAAVPHIAAIAPSFSAYQLRQIEKRMRDNAEELRDEYLQDDLDERRDASVKRAIERLESLYGRIESSQRERVVKMVADSPWQPERWLADRATRSRDTIATLRTLTRPDFDKSQATKVVREWMARTLQPALPDEASQRYYAKLRAYNCAFMAEFHNQTTPAQRRTAAEKLLGWQQDLTALVGTNSLNGNSSGTLRELR